MGYHKAWMWGILVGTWLLAVSAPPAYAQQSPDTRVIRDSHDLKFMGSTYPPYFYEDNKQANGYAVDLLKAMWDEMGLKKHPSIIAEVWREAYYQALNQYNVVLIGIFKTQHREDLFQWVCGADNIEVGLLKLKKSDITITDKSDLNQYTFSAHHSAAGEQLLLSRGVFVDRISRTKDYLGMMRLLAKEKVQLASGPISTLLSQWRRLGLDTNLLETAYVFTEVSVCFGFNKHIPENLVKQYDTALQVLIKNGKMEELKKKHML